MNAHWNLTPLEKQVALSMLRGENPREARQRLHISENAYKTHIQHLLEKTHTSSRLELVHALRSR